MDDIKGIPGATTYLDPLTRQWEPCTKICPHYLHFCQSKCKDWVAEVTRTTIQTATTVVSETTEYHSDNLNLEIIGLIIGAIAVVLCLSLFICLAIKFPNTFPCLRNIRRKCQKLRSPIQEIGEDSRLHRVQIEMTEMASSEEQGTEPLNEQNNL